MPEGNFLGPGLSSFFLQYGSAAEALRAFREAGGQMRTQTFQRLYAELEARALETQLGPAGPLHLKPGEAEVLRVSTERATGLAQEAVVFGRTRVGTIEARRMVVPVKELMSRQWVIEEAERRVRGFRESEEGPQDYEITAVLGGVYIGAYERRPQGE